MPPFQSKLLYNMIHSSFPPLCARLPDLFYHHLPTPFDLLPWAAVTIGNIATSSCLFDTFALLVIIFVLVVVADRVKAVRAVLEGISKGLLSLVQLHNDLSRKAAESFPVTLTPGLVSRLQDQIVHNEFVELASGWNERQTF